MRLWENPIAVQPYKADLCHDSCKQRRIEVQHIPLSSSLSLSLSRRGLGGRRNVQMHLQIEQAEAGGAGGLDTGGVDTVSEVGTEHSGVMSSITM